MSIVAKLRQTIADAQAQIESIQEACTHPDAAVTKTPRKLAITEFYEDEIGGQSSQGWRDGFHCVCGLCELGWNEYADGRKYSQFDTEDLGRI